MKHPAALLNLRNVVTILILCVICTLSCQKPTEDTKTPPDKDSIYFVKGADLSFLPEVRASGITVRNQAGKAEDMLITVRNAGANTVRLRLWHTPSAVTSSLDAVKKLTTEIKSMGLKVMISMHLSDTWADPASQTKPLAWSSLTYDQLKDSVIQYTKLVCQTLKPDYLQIGNEINHGILWPEGRYDNQAQMIELLTSSAKAIRETAPETNIILHHAGIDDAKYFYSKVNGVDFDIIGLSFYPYWHGKQLSALRASINTLKKQFDRPIMIVETSYPFTLEWNDWAHNTIGLEDQLMEGYPATPEGQKQFFCDLMSLLKETPNNAGICYWGGEWISFKGDQATDGSSYENQAMWDFEGRSLPILECYQ